MQPSRGRGGPTAFSVIPLLRLSPPRLLQGFLSFLPSCRVLQSLWHAGSHPRTGPVTFWGNHCLPLGELLGLGVPPMPWGTPGRFPGLRDGAMWDGEAQALHHQVLGVCSYMGGQRQAAGGGGGRAHRQRAVSPLQRTLGTLGFLAAQKGTFLVLCCFSSLSVSMCVSLDPAALQPAQAHTIACSSPRELHPPPSQTSHDRQKPQGEGPGQLTGDAAPWRRGRAWPESS